MHCLYKRLASDSEIINIIKNQHKIPNSVCDIPSYNLSKEKEPEVEDYIQRTLGGGRVSKLELFLICMQGILMINADCYYAWNARLECTLIFTIRKRLISQNILSEEQELKLLDLLFTKYPKSSESWSHRYLLSSPNLYS